MTFDFGLSLTVLLGGIILFGGGLFVIAVFVYSLRNFSRRK